jgi:hypothetical protein
MGSLLGCCRQSQNGDINAFNIARMPGTEGVRLRRLELLKSLNLTFQRFLPPVSRQSQSLLDLPVVCHTAGIIVLST